MATLVIGIGSSGLSILQAAEQFNYEFTNQNQPNEDVEYLCIDTERASKPRATAAGGSTIKMLHVPLTNIQNEIDRLKSNNILDGSWVPSEFEIIAQGGAAGGRPTFGRLGFWAHFDSIYQEIRGLSTRGGQKRVLIVGSLTGGTGSGLCIDLPYLIRHLVDEVNIEGVFTIPPAQGNHNINFYYNSFQALKSLEYYTINSHEYHTTYPNGEQIGRETKYKPPFDLLSITSNEYKKNSAVQGQPSNLNELTTSIGLYVSTLFLKEGDNDQNTDLSSVLDVRRNDAMSDRQQLGRFSTFGITLAQYPKKKLKEYLAIDLARQIINNWVRGDEPDNNIIIQNEAKEAIESAVNSAIKEQMNINVSKNESLDQYLDTLTTAILNKNYGNYQNIDGFLSHNLGPRSDIYQNLDLMVDRVKEDVVNAINYSIKNLGETQLSAHYRFLDKVEKVLNSSNADSILKHWKDAYNIDETGWNEIFINKKEELKRGLNKAELLFYKKEYIKEQLHEIVTLLKMSLTFKTLERIGRGISDPDNPVIANGTRLINRGDLDWYRSLLSDLNDNADFPSFEGRQNEIINNTENFGLFYYFLNANSFRDEAKRIKQRLEENTRVDKKGQDILDNKGGTLLNFLGNFDFNDNENRKLQRLSLYYAIIPHLITHVVHDDNILFGNDLRDISQLIGNNPENTFTKFITSDTNDLQNSPPPFLKAGHFTNADALKRIYCLEDSNAIQSLANSLRDTNQDKIQLDTTGQDKNAIAIPSLTDSVIVFQEYAYYGTGGNVWNNTFIPTRDSESANRLKQSMKEMLHKDKDLSFVYAKFPYLMEVVSESDSDMPVNEEIASMI